MHAIVASLQARGVIMFSWWNRSEQIQINKRQVAIHESQVRINQLILARIATLEQRVTELELELEQEKVE